MKAWISFQHSDANSTSDREDDENFWAFEVIDDLCFDDPDRCLKIIFKIFSEADGDWILANLAAGPIETVLGRHGEMVIDSIAKRAEEDHKFKKVLASVWQGSISKDIWNRIKSITEGVSAL